MSDLGDCPICGGKHKTCYFPTARDGKRYKVCCAKLKGRLMRESPWYDTVKEAVDAWREPTDFRLVCRGVVR